MKKSFLFLLIAVSCQMLGVPDEDAGLGEIRISFYDGALTRVSEEIPDTSDFLLTISGPDGELIYDGSYGDSPESLMVESGTYTINVRSCDFKKPAFSLPQFGDEQCVVVPEGSVVNVRLMCVQMNSGVRLKIDGSFLQECPDAALYLKSAQGKLMYSYSEKRIAYFLPGPVSLMMTENDTDKILLTRTLQSRSVLDINVSAATSDPSMNSDRIRVAVDTTRNWYSEEYVIGGLDKGDSSESALTVSQALDAVGETKVWVCGYIVGGDLTSSSASFDGPFESRTNIVLGSRSSSSDRDNCLSVNLPANYIRDDLNLVDNPALLGRKVCLRGDIVEAYYGMTGMKNIMEYKLVN